MTKQKFHYAWVILLGCVLLEAGGAGLLSNAVALFFGPMAAELGVSNAEMSLYSSIRTIFLAGGLLVVPKLLQRFDSRKLIALSSLVLAGSFAAQAFFYDIRLWYLIAPLNGFSLGCEIMVTVTLIVNNWFRQHRGMVLGISLAASGITTAVYNPVASHWVSIYGWRTTVLITAAIALVLLLISSVLLVYSPEEMGLEPYGKASDERKEAQGQDIGKAPLAFLGCLFLVLVGNSAVTLVGQYSLMTEQLKQPLSLAATLSSTTMIGNMTGKILLGALADRFGCWHALSGAFLLLGISCFLFTGGQQGMMIVCAFFIGFCYFLATMVASLICRELFSERYAETLGRLNAAGYLSSAFSGIVMAALSDLFGSYTPVYLGFGILSLLCIGILYRLKRTQKRHMEDKEF